jgi:hypothetical protein
MPDLFATTPTDGFRLWPITTFKKPGNGAARQRRKG